MQQGLAEIKLALRIKPDLMAAQVDLRRFQQ
jgi:hypothetical protein